jgi:protein-S-isoprenylcysteine O-methyltransferase Ste14
MQRNQLLKTIAGAMIGAVIGVFGVYFKHHGGLRTIPAFTLDQLLWAHRGWWIASVAGWVILSIYWEIAAGKASAAQKSESAPSRGVHVFLTSAAQLMVLAPIRGLGRFLPVSPIIMTIGLMVEVIGVFLALWARVHLGRNWSGRITVKIEHELIRSGPYRFLRHPIYTGLLAMYVGPTLVTGEWLGVAGILVAALAYWRKIRLEEAALESAFGADYENYRRSTWALVPGLF